MALSEFSVKYHEIMFPGFDLTAPGPDSEFVERFDNFAFDEVINHPGLKLSDHDRWLAILACLIGCQGIDEYKLMGPAALRFGVTPAELKEMVYQATAYVGMGRMFPFLRASNEILKAAGIEQSLPGRQTTTEETRRAEGNRCQVEIFGEGMRESWKTAPEETRHISVWLAENCFGDYYTRTGLDLKQREMITFCFLAAQGGCEPQLTAHAVGNMRLGNDRAYLIRIVSAMLPFIGYPRSLNAIECVRKAAEQMNA